MPILEGVNWEDVKGGRELLPEGKYRMLIKSSEFDEEQKNLIVKHEIVDGPDQVGEEWWNWVNLVKNDGGRNDIGYETIKQMQETVFGKGAPETLKPDTDPLNGEEIGYYIIQKDSKDGVTRNRIKKMFQV